MPREHERPISVLRVIARLNVGGPARHVVLLDRGLRDRGYRTLLLHGSVDAGEASLESFASEQNVDARRIRQLGRRLHPLDDIRAFWAVLRTMFREKPDVVHTHTAKAGALGRVSAFIFNAVRRPSQRAIVFHTFHGHVLEGYFSPLASQSVRLAERLLASVTDRIITISPRQRRDIVERFRIAGSDKVVTIALGLELQSLLQAPRSTALREQLGVRADDFLIGYVGRFAPIKDLPTLVAAFAKALSDLPHAHLVLAGDGPTREQILKQIDSLDVANRVHLLGWVADLIELHTSLDVCVLTSLNEGTPVAAIEAMAAGTPVIATSVGGVPDVIEHGRTGLLVPPRDAAELARAIVGLARDPARRQEMAASARKDVAERFSPARLVEEIDSLYRAAFLEKRGQGGAPDA